MKPPREAASGTALSCSGGSIDGDDHARRWMLGAGCSMLGICAKPQAALPFGFDLDPAVGADCELNLAVDD
jgi:hypothetical protein